MLRMLVFIYHPSTLQRLLLKYRTSVLQEPKLDRSSVNRNVDSKFFVQCKMLL